MSERKDIYQRVKGDDVCVTLRRIIEIGISTKQRIFLEGMGYPRILENQNGIRTLLEDAASKTKLTIITAKDIEADYKKDELEFFTKLHKNNVGNVDFISIASNQLVNPTLPLGCPTYWGDMGGIGDGSNSMPAIWMYLFPHDPKPKEHNHEGLIAENISITQDIYNQFSDIIKDTSEKKFALETIEDIYNNGWYEANIDWLKENYLGQWIVIMKGAFYKNYKTLEEALEDLRRNDEVRCPNKLVWRIEE
jgi:hypothetical protein